MNAQHLLLALCLGAVIIACGDDPLPTSGATDTTEGTPSDVSTDTDGSAIDDTEPPADGTHGGGDLPDAGPLPDLGPEVTPTGDTTETPDGAVTDPCEVEPLGFMCPCDYNSECESGFCVLIDEQVASSVCTITCEQSCPDGWSCTEAIGGDDPVFICLPPMDNLCDPCATHADCPVEGDLCLEIGSSTFCGRDCSDPDSPCPAEYGCETFEHEGSEVSQCLPLTGSCICGPEIDLSNDPDNCGYCLNVCAFDGAEADCVAGQCVLVACSDGYVDLDGDSANGCEYPCELTSDTDVPDADGLDSNCDGLDGDPDRAVFVAPWGDDDGAGTMDDPLATLGAGSAQALLQAKDHVYVAAGAYDEAVVISSGVSLFGGFSADSTWSHAPAQHETRIQVAEPDGSGAIRGIVADGLTAPTIVDGFTVDVAANTSPGGSSYGVWIRQSGSHLTVSACQITPGNGAVGTHGGDGVSGSPGAVGADGGTTVTTDCWCNEPETFGGFGGAGGPSTCPGGVGAGGKGGDSECGEMGNAGAPSPDGTPGGVPELHGANGAAGADGSHGTGGVGGSVTADGLWNGSSGSDGAPGAHGLGGGGGGAGDGYDTAFTCAIYGGGGGGGGSAGCGGTAGAGGGAGGASIGVFLLASDPSLIDNLIGHRTGGNGGHGGAGGGGGAGQGGGDGGGGYDGATDGGSGGTGGHGGGAGHGGGGAGGAAWAVYLVAGSTPQCLGNTYIPYGTGGIGGVGGDGSGEPGGSGAWGAVSDPSAGCDLL